MGQGWRRILGLVSGVALFACGGSGDGRCTADAACGSGSFCSTGVCVADTSSPVLHVTSPASGQLVSSSTVALTGAFDDAAGGGVTHGEYSTDGGASGFFAVVAGSFSVEVPVPDLDGGSLTITARGADRAGNEASGSVTIVVDRVAPVLTIDGEDAVCDATCTGAVVRAAVTTLSLAGSAADGRGLVGGHVYLDIVDQDGGDVARVTLSAAPEWSYDWDVSALTDDGRWYTVGVTATDDAGHMSGATRYVWVDRVPPTGDVPAAVSYKRHVAPTAALLVFSEPMDAASVRALTTVTRRRDSAAVSTDTLDAADGRSFGLAEGTLEPYTAYDIVLAPGALDRAGNAMTASTYSSFQTELLAPASGFSPPSTTASQPRIATDVDGKPFVVYGTTGSPRLAYWDGRGNWVDGAVALTGLTGAEPADLMILGGEGLVQPYIELHVLFRVAGTGTDTVYYAMSTDFTTWRGAFAASGSPDVLATDALHGWRPSFHVSCGYLGCGYPVTYANAAGGQRTYQTATAWVAPTLVTSLTAPLSGVGDAFIEQGSVRYLQSGTYYPTGLTANTGGAVAGPKPASRGTPHIAFARTEIVGHVMDIPIFDDLVYLACESGPPWPSVRAAGAAPAASLDLVTSDTTVALAIGKTTGSVRFGTTASGDCTDAPSAPTWLPEIAEAREPAVALGADGTTPWMAYVSSSTGRLIVTP